MNADPLEGLDAINWGKMKVSGGKPARVPEALQVLADPKRDDSDKEIALRRIYTAFVDTGPVFSGVAAAAPFVVRLMPNLTLSQRASLSLSLVFGLCAGDTEALSLGIPSGPAHKARYGKGNGKVVLDAIAGAFESAISLTLSKDAYDRGTGIFLMPYVGGDRARAEASLLSVATSDPTPWLRGAAAYALAIGARHGGNGPTDALCDDLQKGLGNASAPFVALIRLVRDGENASDQTVAACGVTPALTKAMQEVYQLFFFGGVGKARSATKVALLSIGARGVARQEAIQAADLAAYLLLKPSP